MKVQGGAPGQILDLDEVQERRRAKAADRTRKKFGEQALGWVHDTAPAPSPQAGGSEEETRRGLRRFMDWVASVGARPKPGTEPPADDSRDSATFQQPLAGTEPPLGSSNTGSEQDELSATGSDGALSATKSGRAGTGLRRRGSRGSVSDSSGMGTELTRRAVRMYSLCSSLNDQNKNQKGQRISRVA